MEGMGLDHGVDEHQGCVNEPRFWISYVRLVLLEADFGVGTHGWSLRVEVSLHSGTGISHSLLFETQATFHSFHDLMTSI